MLSFILMQWENRSTFTQMHKKNPAGKVKLGVYMW